MHGILLGLLSSAAPALDSNPGDLQQNREDPLTDLLSQALLRTLADPEAAESFVDPGELPISSLLLQRDKLQPLDGSAGVVDGFGWNVALDEDTLLVMACFAPGGSSAYVYTRSNDTWAQQAKLTPSTSAECGIVLAGGSVALDGDTALVGLTNFTLSDPGTVIVYVRSADTWIEQAVLAPSDPPGDPAFDMFGDSVALDGDTALIGQGLGGDDPAAYVFTRSGDTWTEQARLTPMNPPSISSFGHDVALDGDTALVADNDHDDPGVHVFVRDGEDWSEQTVLRPSDGAQDLLFGVSVALDGDTALVGAQVTNIRVPPAAYVYRRTGDEWTEHAKIAPPSLACEGLDVALQDDTALIGGGGRNLGDGEDRMVCIYARNGDVWDLEGILRPADHHQPSAQRFGRRLAIDGDTVVATTHPVNLLGVSYDGAAYVFDTRPPAPAVGITPRARAVDFGSVRVGESSEWMDVTLQNNGSADLQVHAEIGGEDMGDFPELLGNVTCRDGTAPIPPGDDCTLRARFAPLDVGTRTARLDFESNAPTTTDSVLLSGEGVPKPPTIDVDPDRLMATLASGDTSDEAMVISNIGFPDALEWEVVTGEILERTAPLRPRRPATVLPSPGDVAQADLARLKTSERESQPVPAPVSRSPETTTAGDGLTLTHSESLHIEGGITPACVATSGAGTLVTKYLRTFTLEDFGLNGDFEIVEVAFGVDTLTTSADIAINLYTLEGDFVFENLTLIGTTTETLSAQSLTLVTVPVTGTAPAGSTLVVEIDAPSLVDVGGRFFAGSNSAGETAPSYVAAPGADNCDIDEPTRMADIGFPDTHLVMTVTGTVNCDMPDWLDLAPLAGTVPSGASEPVTVTFDAAGLAAGAYAGRICLANNDPIRSLLLVPVDLTVLGSELAFDPLSVDFGDVEGGTTSPPETVLLQSVGAFDATGLTFEILGDDGLDADTSACGTTLPIGGQCEVGVSFTPPVPGPAAATLRVHSDDGAIATVDLAGNGVPETEAFLPMGLEVDTEPIISDANGVFEPGELVQVAPIWRNDGVFGQFLDGIASNFTGPEGPNYSLPVAGADYGEVESGAMGRCQPSGPCYEMGLGPLGVERPALHWDGTFDEILSDETTYTWTLHIGESFADVPRTSPFYSAVETLLHSAVTGGCTDIEYCPTGGNTRGQMAVFLLKAAESGDYTPPACEAGEELFADVPFDSALCPWIEELAGRRVTSGCGNGNYCPGSPVTRGQMAVFLLKAFEGEGYVPPECTGEFSDVICPSTFTAWVEELSDRGITGGCAADPPAYCPAAPVTRAQMAAFITKTFGLTLNGP